MRVLIFYINFFCAIVQISAWYKTSHFKVMISLTEILFIVNILLSLIEIHDIQEFRLFSFRQNGNNNMSGTRGTYIISFNVQYKYQNFQLLTQIIKMDHYNYNYVTGIFFQMMTLNTCVTR